MLPALPPEARVLDLGTDPRVLHVMARSAGYAHVVGVTRDETRGDEWVADVSGPDGSTEGRYRILNCDIQRDTLPVDDGSFDLVTCFETIEHLLDPMKMLMEANRVLKPEGRLLLSTPNVLSWDTLVRSARRRHPMHYPALFPDCYVNRHNIEYTPAQIGNLLRSAGFDADVRTETVFPWGIGILRKLSFLLAGFDPRGRGDVIFAAGRRVSPPLRRWDPSVYELSAEQAAANDSEAPG